MTDDFPPDRRNPFPCNTDALEGEITRYRTLSERCGHAAHQAERLPLEAWVGAAANAFESYHERLTAQWTVARVVFIECADALRDYRELMITIQGLGRSVVQQAHLDGDVRREAEDLELLRAQKSDQAALTATKLLGAAKQLEALGPLLKHDQKSHASTVPTSADASTDRSTQVQDFQQLDFSKATIHPLDQTPRMLQHRTRNLCAAVLDGDYISAEHL
ncbi:MAG: hypothetical protein ACJ72N_18360 [Labedaea sp.]